MKSVSPSIKVLASGAAAMIAVGAVVRFYFLLTLVGEWEIPARELLAAIPVGAANDAVIAFYMMLPLVFLRAVLPAGARWSRFLLVAVVMAMIGVLALVTVSEIFFWREFARLPDRLVFHYLAFPLEVASFLEEQLFFSLALMALGIGVYLIYRLVRRPVRRLTDAPIGGRERWSLLVAALAGFALAPLIFKAGPLPGSEYRHANEVAKNSVFNVVHQALIDETRWAGVFPQMTEARMLKVLRATASGTPPPAVLEGIRHIVLIVEESFAGDTWWNREKRHRFMPNFSRRIKTGIYFSNVYASGSRTTRGLESLLHGYPPLPGIALNQRPGYRCLPSLPRALARAGFTPVFVYGGWPGFSNFAEYWRGIGYRDVYTRYDFPNRWFETSWGVADEILFDRILEEMDRRTAAGEEVFLTTLTVSNHLPFDFPAGRIPLPADERRMEFALAYADWALDRFLVSARERDWYADTLFIIVADHGPVSRGNAAIPVTSYRVPMLMMAEKYLPPKEVTQLGGMLDFPGTLLQILGIRDTEGFWGSSLVDEVDGIVPVEFDYHVGVLQPGKLTVLLRGQKTAGWAVDGDRAVAQGADREGIDIATAVFQAAHANYYGLVRSDGPDACLP